MSKLPYHVQGENATSVCILRSWLRDVGVQVGLPTDSKHDLTVTTSDGKQLAVRVRNDQRTSVDGVEVRAADFTSKKDSVALAAFYYITDAAGFPRQKPAIRDQLVVLNEQGNPRKLHYRDEEFLVAIRHNEFRRAPNPNEKAWKQYKAVMEEAVWWFLRGMTHNTSHFEMCIRHGYEVSDLMSFARCYVVNFTGRYETETPVACDNERKCYEYIKQRLKYDLLPVLWKKERSTIPDAETVRVALFGSAMQGTDEISPDPTDAYIRALDNPKLVELARQNIHTPRMLPIADIEEEAFKNTSGKRRPRRKKSQDELRADAIDNALDAFLEGRDHDTDYVARRCELDTSSVAARQRSATERLGKLLSELPHDAMVEALSATAGDYKFDTPTRREARRRLNEHTASCRDCSETPEEKERRQSRNRRKRDRQRVATLGSR